MTTFAPLITDGDREWFHVGQFKTSEPRITNLRREYMLAKRDLYEQFNQELACLQQDFQIRIQELEEDFHGKTITAARG